MPLSVSVYMGRMLSEIADINSNIQFVVISGHCHPKETWEYKHFDNLLVLTGKADYGNIFVSGEFYE